MNKILETFYKTHPIINTSDWLSQKDTKDFVGDNHRMQLWRATKSGLFNPKTITICGSPLYLRVDVEDYVKETQVLNSHNKHKITLFEFEKRKLAITRYYVSTKEYIPTCWLEELVKPFYKRRTAHYMKSRLDHPLIRTVPAFHMRWSNVEDVVHYLINGKGVPLSMEYKKLGLDIDVSELQKMVDR